MKKGFKMTLEQRRRVSEAHKGQIPWNKGKKGVQISARKGVHLSKELKKKISEATKKALANPEIRKKISEAGRGRKPWNMGVKTGIPSPMKGEKHSAATKKKMSIASKQKWLNTEYRKRMSQVHKGRPSPRKGKKASEETRRRLSESHKGKPSVRKGMKLTTEQRNKVSEATKKAMAKPDIRKKFLEGNIKRYQDPASLEIIKATSRKTILKLYESNSFPKQTNTQIEKDIKKELVSRGYVQDKDFIHQYRFMDKFSCDFGFPQQKVIIEAYGDFWHGNPKKYPDVTKLHPHQIKGIKRDKSKEAYITKVDNGAWVYLPLWESDIKKNVSECVDRIEKALTESK